MHDGTISTPEGVDYNYKLIPYLTFKCSNYCKDFLLSKDSGLFNKSLDFWPDYAIKQVILMQTNIKEDHYDFLTAEQGEDLKKKLEPIIRLGEISTKLTEKLKLFISESKETGAVENK